MTFKLSRICCQNPKIKANRCHYFIFISNTKSEVSKLMMLPYYQAEVVASYCNTSELQQDFLAGNWMAKILRDNYAIQETVTH